MIQDPSTLALLFDRYGRDLMIITDDRGRVLASNRRAHHALWGESSPSEGRLVDEVLNEVMLDKAKTSLALPLHELPGYLPGDRLVALRGADRSIFYGLDHQATHLVGQQSLQIHSITPLAVDPFDFIQQRCAPSLSDERLDSPPFLLEVAHEIKNALHLVLGLLNTSEPKASVASRDQTQLKWAAGKLAELVHDMGDISRLRRGDFSLHPKPFDLRASFEYLIASYQLALGDRGVQIKLDCQADCGMVLGDEQRIQQITRNLIDNALRFTEQGFVHVLVQLSSLSPHSHHHHLQLKVQDSGIGLPEDFHIGGPSAQHPTGRSSLIRQAGGSGIGLSLCERLCEQMNGRITARNAPEGGAVFEVSLLLEQIGPTSSSRALSDRTSMPVPDHPLSGARILLVDDAPFSSEMTGAWLLEAGAAPHAVPDGKQALELLLQQPFDLVVMDAMLPAWSGAQTCQRIRACPPRSEGGPGDLPIIGLTGQIAPSALDEMRQAGMDEVLSKPVARAELLHTLARHLGRKK